MTFISRYLYGGTLGISIRDRVENIRQPNRPAHVRPDPGMCGKDLCHADWLSLKSFPCSDPTLIHSTLRLTKYCSASIDG